MSHRRIFETVGIGCSDVDALNPILDAVRAMLAERDDVDASEPLIVNLNRYGPSALELTIHCQVADKRCAPYRALKQEMMLAVVEIIRRHGAEIAYPTSTLHVAGLPGSASARPPHGDPWDRGTRTSPWG